MTYWLKLWIFLECKDFHFIKFSDLTCRSDHSQYIYQNFTHVTYDMFEKLNIFGLVRQIDFFCCNLFLTSAYLFEKCKKIMSWSPLWFTGSIKIMMIFWIFQIFSNLNNQWNSQSVYIRQTPTFYKSIMECTNHLYFEITWTRHARLKADRYEILQSKVISYLKHDEYTNELRSCLIIAG